MPSGTGRCLRTENTLLFRWILPLLGVRNTETIYLPSDGDRMQKQWKHWHAIYIYVYIYTYVYVVYAQFTV